MLKNKSKDSTPIAWEEIPVVNPKPKRGIFVLIDGEEGTGKSSLALTIGRVGEVAYGDIDQSLDRAKRPAMPKGKRFKARRISVRYGGSTNPATVMKVCLPAWKTLRRSMFEASKTFAAACIVDTGSEAWELLRLAMFGTTTPRGVTKALYGPVNSEFRNFVRTIHRTNLKHLVFVNQVKDEYDKDEKTGRKERVGHKEIGYMADIAIKTYKKDGEFRGKVTMCKLAPYGPSMEGMILKGDTLDLLYVIATATGTEVEDWL